MRFGQVLWSEHEGETKFRLVLVEKGYDESRGLVVTYFTSQCFQI